MKHNCYMMMTWHLAVIAGLMALLMAGRGMSAFAGDGP
jgi:hypothetical protein